MYDDPDLAVVTTVDGNQVTVTFQNLLENAFDNPYIPPADLEDQCEKAYLNQYSYDADALCFQPQYEALLTNSLWPINTGGIEEILSLTVFTDTEGQHSSDDRNDQCRYRVTSRRQDLVVSAPEGRTCTTAAVHYRIERSRHLCRRQTVSPQCLARWASIQSLADPPAR